MTGAGCLFVLGVVVFAAGWLAKDAHDRYVAEMNEHETFKRRSTPPSVRVMREPRDWNREGWL